MLTRFLTKHQFFRDRIAPFLWARNHRDGHGETPNGGGISLIIIESRIGGHSTPSRTLASLGSLTTSELIR